MPIRRENITNGETLLLALIREMISAIAEDDHLNLSQEIREISIYINHQNDKLLMNDNFYTALFYHE